MSIILKGIDLPKDDSFCMVVGITNAGSDITIFYKDITKEKEHRGIEAMQIDRPHGRLGDLDVLLEESLKEGAYNYVDSWQIAEQPTILEAEE